MERYAYVARIDRTYTAEDVLRIFQNNLSESERSAVLIGLGIVPTEEEQISEPEVSFLKDLVNLVQEFIPLVGTILASGALLGDLMNQVDIERARTESANIRIRNISASSILNSIDF